MKETLGADALVLAGDKLYKRIVLEPLIDAITEEGLDNLGLSLKTPQGEIPITDIFVLMAPGEPNNN